MLSSASNNNSSDSLNKKKGRSVFSYSVSFRHGWIRSSNEVIGILPLYFPPLVSTSFSGSFFLYAGNDATGIFKLLLPIIPWEKRCDYFYFGSSAPKLSYDAAREYVYTFVFISVFGSIIENYQFVLLPSIPTQQHRIYFIFMLLFFLIFGCTICGILAP